MSNIPSELRYTKDHEWIRLEGNEGVVGVTDYAQEQLGDVVYLEFTASKGSQVKQGDVIGTIESVKTVSDLFSPVTGTITAWNPNLNDQPELVNAEPYTLGWLVRIQLDDPSEVDNLLDAGAYAGQLGE